MNEIRLIDANILKANLPEPTNITQKLVYKTLCDLIDNAPTVEQPQGEWIKQYGKSYELITNEGILVGEFTKCPKCQYDKARGSNFCPNCGADMRGGAE